MGHAILERVVLFGTRSADYIRASGHGGCIATEVILQATIGRIHDRTRTLRRYVRFHLHRGHRPYMTHCGPQPDQNAALQPSPDLILTNPI
jgi:hypothetical protein